MPNTIKLRLVYPASRDAQNTLVQRKIELKSGSIEIEAGPPVEASPWDHLSGSSESRLHELISAIKSDQHQAIICGRGGYGASDLLPLIPWGDLQGLAPKLIVGFSDISALHAAFWTRLRWPGLHAPMPATSYWSENPDTDLPLLIEAVRSRNTEFKLDLAGDFQTKLPVSGVLFGGCLSVLTNLIGTPYFPASLHGYIIFLEDIDEPYGRIFRHLNQWIQAGALHGVKALILGRFIYDDQDQDMPALAEEFSLRAKLPVFYSRDFGHCSPNLPLMVGASATIEPNQLIWKRSDADGTLTT